MNVNGLELLEHPEGGRFREVHRSDVSLTLPDGRERSALTHIYFHLAAGEVSAFHRVEQEEVWNLYQGAGLRLWLADESTRTVESVTLGAEETRFCHVVPAGVWQAAEPLDGDILAGCSVAPGFDFADFQLLQPVHPLAETLRDAKLDHFIA